MNRLLLISAALSSLFLSACSVQNLAKDTNGAVNVNQVNLVREYQRVVTYDCNHHVTSDSVETIKSPTKAMRITPTDPRNVGGSKFVNRETGSSPTVLGYTDFRVDYSYGALNMHVLPGINTIDYTFYNCDQWSTDAQGSSYCAVANTVKEKGTSTINVNYTERHLDGMMEVTNCPSASPTP